MNEQAQQKQEEVGAMMHEDQIKQRDLQLHAANKILQTDYSGKINTDIVKPKHDTPFWMVFVQDGHSPTVKHLTRASAEEEAQRLCASQNRPTYILKAEEKITVAPQFVHTAL